MVTNGCVPLNESIEFSKGLSLNVLQTKAIQLAIQKLQKLDISLVKEELQCNAVQCLATLLSL